LTSQLVDQLEAATRDVDPFTLEADTARTAYWINAYNLTLLRELAIRPRRGWLPAHRRLFRAEAHLAGGHSFSLDQIEHGLLRGNRRPPFALRRTLAPGDPRLGAAPEQPDPRVHFALNCGARSCPPVRVYSNDVEAELEHVTRAYLSAETDSDPTRRTLVLPGLMKLYRRDFGESDAMVRFAVAHLPDSDWIEEAGDALRLRFSRFDWRMAR
jgi:hypothetical protein